MKLLYFLTIIICCEACILNHSSNSKLHKVESENIDPKTVNVCIEILRNELYIKIDSNRQKIDSLEKLGPILNSNKSNLTNDTLYIFLRNAAVPEKASELIRYLNKIQFGYNYKVLIKEDYFALPYGNK